MTVLRQNSSPAAVPHFVEHPKGTTVRCSAMRDRGLIQLITASDDILVITPNCHEPTPTMRQIGDALARIHRGEYGGRLVNDESEGEVHVGLSFERIDLVLNDDRVILAGAARRNVGTKAERSVAVIGLVPRHITRCDLTVKLDN